MRSGMALHAFEHFCSISFQIFFLFIYLIPAPLQSTSGHHASCSRCWILDSGIKSPLASPEKTMAQCSGCTIVLDRILQPTLLYFISSLACVKIRMFLTEKLFFQEPIFGRDRWLIKWLYFLLNGSNNFFFSLDVLMWF